MKICGQEVKLLIHGRERTFSEQELIYILEKYFSNEATEQENTTNGLNVPNEGRWFEVNPQDIKHSFFQQERKDIRQERTRKLILEAFDKVESSPEKYGRKFKTMMPKKKWTSKTVLQLNRLACKLGDHNADWVEQALEWAQRISNGESWETVCNNPDSANWYRMILWKNEKFLIIGGSRNNFSNFPASGISSNYYDYNGRLDHTVPLVVLYEK